MEETRQEFAGWRCPTCKIIIRIISGGCCPVCWENDLEPVSIAVPVGKIVQPKPEPIRVNWQRREANQT